MEYADVQKAGFGLVWPPPRLPNRLPEKMQAVIYSAKIKGPRIAWKAVADNLIYAANRIPEISDTIVEIDNAMKWGFNFDHGPLRNMGCHRGGPQAVEKMDKPKGIDVPDGVKNMLAAGHNAFYKSEGGKTYFFDFATEGYKELSVSPNIISLAALKADNKVVKTSCQERLLSSISAMTSSAASSTPR
jgi:3-hydroxyacyl-CoA dehydrogenase